MSDHGFAPYYRSYNLNTWLLENGYIRLKDEAEGAAREELDFSSVDWKRTRAFSLGFASIYLNMKGRDPEGAVEPGEAAVLVDEICGRLLTEKDPKNGGAVFVTMYKTRDVYRGGAMDEAPEIVVGFRSGYGASDASALGEFSKEVVEDNMSPWSGSHLMAAEEVPGIILSNRKLFLDYPRLYDLTVTILKEYGIEKTPEMIGRSIW
jgi:predicted AlkP superfamily phosphohydrolase/phosphomutase